MDELHDNNANERIHLIPVPAALSACRKQAGIGDAGRSPENISVIDAIRKLTYKLNL
jgi:hypothetical protein